MSARRALSSPAMTAPLLVTLGYLLLNGCSDETEAVLQLTTEADCAHIVSTLVQASAGNNMAELDLQPAIARVNGCRAANTIGHLRLTPEQTGGMESALQVVTGLGQDAETCFYKGFGRGCLVDRRMLRYRAGESIIVPVHLPLGCESAPCAPNERCFRGTCVVVPCEQLGVCPIPWPSDEDTLETAIPSQAVDSIFGPTPDDRWDDNPGAAGGSTLPP